MCFIDCEEYRLIRYIGLVFVSISVLKLSAVGFEPAWVPVAGVTAVFSIPVGSNPLQVSYQVLPSTLINKCMPSLYSTYVYKQIEAIYCM